PVDLLRPYLNAYGDDGSYRPPQVRRTEEREAERRYEEAVGQARSEQQAVQELAPDGTNPTPPATPSPVEDATIPGEKWPLDEEPPRPGPS
ncbi:MAG TPA: hypothetical protein VE225_00655, partial [Rubrobacteraceae bacterium]|nr:hypothetical protein [Rubrobacteraceae bacterium]